MQYSSILTQAKRFDDYVNATKLCKQFGKDWYEYKRSARTKAILKALQNRDTGNIPVIEAKRGVGTFIHPILAIDLAEWLDPDFAIFVKGTFIRYAQADTTLAEDIVSRTDDLEGLEKLTTRAEGRKKQLKAYHGLHDQLAAHGAESKHHAFVNRHNNNLVGISTRKTGITLIETDALTVIETVERMALAARQSTRHPNHAVNICKKSGNEAADFLRQKQLLG